MNPCPHYPHPRSNPTNPLPLRQPGPIRLRSHRLAGTNLAGLLASARREASALAWATDLPQFVLPCLVEEKEAEARAYWQRQRQIFAQTARLFRQATAQVEGFAI